MPWVLLALQVMLSAVLLIAATEKALRPDEFAAALRLSHLPAAAAAALVVVVPLLEVALALALPLASGRWLPLAFGGTILLFGAFTVWMGWVRARRLRVRCGCFGPGGGVVGGRTIARNLLLLAGACGGLVLAERTRGLLPGPSLPMVVTVTSLGLSLALVLALRSVRPHLILSFDQYLARSAGAAEGE